MKTHLTRKDKASDKNFLINFNCKKLLAKQHAIRLIKRLLFDRETTKNQVESGGKRK